MTTENEKISADLEMSQFMLDSIRKRQLDLILEMAKLDKQDPEYQKRFQEFQGTFNELSTARDEHSTRLLASINLYSKRLHRLTVWLVGLTVSLVVLSVILAILTGILIWKP